MWAWGERRVMECNDCGKRIDDLSRRTPTTRHFCAWCAHARGMTIVREDDAAGPVSAPKLSDSDSP